MKNKKQWSHWIIIVLLYSIYAYSEISEHKIEKGSFTFETLHEISMTTYDAGYFDGLTQQMFNKEDYRRDSLQVDSLLIHYLK